MLGWDLSSILRVEIKVDEAKTIAVAGLNTNGNGRGMKGVYLSGQSYSPTVAACDNSAMGSLTSIPSSEN